MQHSVSARTSDLLSAVGDGDTRFLERLLAAGYDPNVRDDMGQTPVMVALLRSDRSALNVLLRSGAKLNTVTADGLYPMALAAIAGDVEALFLLTGHCADFESPIPGYSGALEHALSAGRREAATYLALHGADIDCQSPEGDSTVDRMLARGDMHAVDFLVRRGAHPTDGTPASRSGALSLRWPLSRASLSAAIQRLATYQSRRKASQLVELVSRGEVGKALSAGHRVDPLSVDETGCPLLLAVLRATCARKSAHATDSASTGIQVLIDSLIGRGATMVGRHRPTGQSVLHALLELGLEKHAVGVMRAIAGRELVNLSDNQLERPLHYAVRLGLYQAADALLAAGADLNPINERKESPLHLSVLYGHAEMAEMLIQRGANVSLRQGDGHDFETLVALRMDDRQKFDKGILTARARIRGLTIFSADNPLTGVASSTGFQELSSKRKTPR